MFKSALLKEHFNQLLTESEQNIWQENTTITLYEKEQVVFYEGRVPFGVFSLKKGKVKLYKTGDNGKKQIFQICCAGDIFGFHAVLSDYPYPDSAATLEECEIEFVPKQCFINLIKSNNKLSFSLLQTLSEEFRKFIEQETMLSQKPVRERVALVLSILNELYQVDDKNSIITLSRLDLADLCGTVRETLVRTLHEFKDDELIQSINTTDLEVLNVKKLRIIADL